MQGSGYAQVIRTRQLIPFSFENKGAKHYHCQPQQMMTPILVSVTGKPCPLDRVELQDFLNGSQQRRQVVQLSQKTTDSMSTTEQQSRPIAP